MHQGVALLHATSTDVQSHVGILPRHNKDAWACCIACVLLFGFHACICCTGHNLNMFSLCPMSWLQVIIASNADAAATASSSGRQTTEDWTTVVSSMFGERNILHAVISTCCLAQHLHRYFIAHSMSAQAVGCCRTPLNIAAAASAVRMRGVVCAAVHWAVRSCLQPEHFVRACGQQPTHLAHIAVAWLSWCPCAGGEESAVGRGMARCAQTAVQHSSTAWLAVQPRASQ